MGRLLLLRGREGVKLYQHSVRLPDPREIHSHHTPYTPYHIHTRDAVFFLSPGERLNLFSPGERCNIFVTLGTARERPDLELAIRTVTHAVKRRRERRPLIPAPETKGSPLQFSPNGKRAHCAVHRRDWAVKPCRYRSPSARVQTAQPRDFLWRFPKHQHQQALWRASQRVAARSRHSR